MVMNLFKTKNLFNLTPSTCATYEDFSFLPELKKIKIKSKIVLFQNTYVKVT